MLQRMEKFSLAVSEYHFPLKDTNLYSNMPSRKSLDDCGQYRQVSVTLHKLNFRNERYLTQVRFQTRPTLN